VKALFPLFIVFLTFFSCSARINGSLAADSSAVVTVSMSLENAMENLIRKSNKAFGQEDRPVLDGSAVALSMSNAPGIASVTFKNISSRAIEGTIRISEIGEFLAVSDSDFISYNQGPGGGKCVISINRGNGPEILKRLSPEIYDYLNALMAPIVTGDDWTKLEYLREVGDFFNKALSGEIENSVIRASINFPGQVTSVKGGTFSGRTASFDIPLPDLLVLENPLIYEVNWKSQ
jgi:hypothetical protein